VDVDAILTDADQRDQRATQRDSAAYRRDMAANLHAFLTDTDDTDAYHDRESSAQDRRDSRSDRSVSKHDRHTLAGVPPTQDKPEDAATTRLKAAAESFEAATKEYHAERDGTTNSGCNN
jgi:hypothetical protein